MIVLVRVVVALLSFIAITAFLSMLEEKMALATKSDTVRAGLMPGPAALASLVADYTPVIFSFVDCRDLSLQGNYLKIQG